MLENTDPFLLALAVFLTALGWCLDACKFIFLARAAGEHLSFRQTIPVIWINYFGSAITPMQSGGGPFQIYLLYKNGVSVGKSVAITLVRTLQVIFLLCLIIPFSIFSEADFIEKHTMLKWFVGYVVVLIVVLSFLLGASIFRPHWIKRWSNGFLVRRSAWAYSNPAFFWGRPAWTSREIDNYSVNMRLFQSTGRY